MNWIENQNEHNQMILTNYNFNPDEGRSISTYLVKHCCPVQKNTLEQELTVNRYKFGGFQPYIFLDNFPENLSERESMLKLADWLQRIGATIEDNWSTP